MKVKKAVKKPSNFIEVKMTVYKKDGDITRKELNSFNDSFIAMVERKNMFCGGSIGLKKERN
jgi:hypothetical protein